MVLGGGTFERCLGTMNVKSLCEWDQCLYNRGSTVDPWPFLLLCENIARNRQSATPKEPSSEHNHADALTLDFPASKTEKSVYKLPSLALLQQPELRN